MTETTTGLLKLSDEYGAHNYHPLPIVAAEAEGAWVTDVEGRRYLDLLAAYSAQNGPNWSCWNARLTSVSRSS